MARSFCLLCLVSCFAGVSALVMPASRLAVSTASAASLRMRGASIVMEDELKKGKCKWFDSTKGFGFIEIDGEGQDIFVHQSDIYSPGFRSLAEGEDLEFKVTTDPKSGKLKAVEVTGPEGNYVQGAPRQDFGDGY